MGSTERGAVTLFLAMILDAVMGEPRWLWSRLTHPAVAMGRLIGWADQRFNHGTGRKAKGVATMAGLVLGAWVLGRMLQAVPGQIIDIVICATLLAQRSLCDHVSAVATALQQGIPAGRQAVAMIVGRDTRNMDAPAISRAAIESAAENLSDGVIAPAFWFAVAGLPGLLIYKITNTADSMIGYRTARHAQFGWAAARFDDVLNLIPARLTALLLWLPGRNGTWRDIARDARLHRSPNAGWPESAMARALNTALSGPRSYDGALRDFPWVHPKGRRHTSAADINASVRMLWWAWTIALLVAVWV